MSKIIITLVQKCVHLIHGTPAPE